MTYDVMLNGERIGGVEASSAAAARLLGEPKVWRRLRHLRQFPGFTKPGTARTIGHKMPAAVVSCDDRIEWHVRVDADELEPRCMNNMGGTTGRGARCKWKPGQNPATCWRCETTRTMTGTRGEDDDVRVYTRPPNGNLRPFSQDNRPEWDQPRKKKPRPKKAEVRRGLF